MAGLPATRFKCRQSKIEKKPMGDLIEKAARRPAQPKLTLRSLHEELAALNQRVEELEDLRELNQAIERQGNKPLVPWAKAKKQLGLA